MLQPACLRKALKLLIFLFAAVTLTGCYSLKSVPLSSIPQSRNVIMLHADDSLWAVSNYTISGKDLTGLIYQDSLQISKTKVTHLYAAPLSAVQVEGTRITVPVGNIGKADYYTTDWWQILGGTAIATVLLLTIIPSLFY